KGVRPRRGLACRLPLAGPPRRFRGDRRKPSGLRRALGRGLSGAFRLREVEGLVTDDSGTTPGGPRGPPGPTRARPPPPRRRTPVPPRRRPRALPPRRPPPPPPPPPPRPSPAPRPPHRRPGPRPRRRRTPPRH